MVGPPGVYLAVDLEVVAGLEVADGILEPIVRRERRLDPRRELEAAGVEQRLLDPEDVPHKIIRLLADRALQAEIEAVDRRRETIEAVVDRTAVDVGVPIDLSRRVIVELGIV